MRSAVNARPGRISIGHVVFVTEGVPLLLSTSARS